MARVAKPKKRKAKLHDSASASKMGAPSKYSPAFCASILPLFAEGLSICEVAVKLGVSRATFYSWIDVHSDFKDAVERGKELSQAWWEVAGRAGLFAGKKFNATAFIFQMKNRFPDNYSDKQQVEHSGTFSYVLNFGGGATNG